MFKGDYGIEVASVKRGSKYVEFLKGLKPGASFAQTEDGKPVEDKHVASLRAAARELGLKLVTRKQDDGGYRVWVSKEKPARAGNKK